MTEKLFTGMLNHNKKTKQKNTKTFSIELKWKQNIYDQFIICLNIALNNLCPNSKLMCSYKLGVVFLGHRQTEKTRHRCYKTFFMLNSSEHDI